MSEQYPAENRIDSDAEQHESLETKSTEFPENELYALGLHITFFAESDAKTGLLHLSNSLDVRDALLEQTSDERRKVFKRASKNAAKDQEILQETTSNRAGVMAGLMAFVARQHQEALSPDISPEESEEALNKWTKTQAQRIQKGKKNGVGGDAELALSTLKHEYHYLSAQKRAFPLVPGAIVRASHIVSQQKDISKEEVVQPEHAQDRIETAAKLLDEAGAPPNTLQRWRAEEEQAHNEAFQQKTPEEKDAHAKGAQEHFASILTTRRLVDSLVSGELDYASLCAAADRIQDYRRQQRDGTLINTQEGEGFTDIHTFGEVSILPEYDRTGRETDRVVIRSKDNKEAANVEYDNDNQLALLLDIQKRLIARGHFEDDMYFIRSQLDKPHHAESDRNTEDDNRYYGIVLKHDDAESIMVVNKLRKRAGKTHAIYVVNGEAFDGELDWRTILNNPKPEARAQGAVRLLKVHDPIARALELLQDPEHYEKTWNERHKKDLGAAALFHALHTEERP